MNYYCHYCDRRCKKESENAPYWHCANCHVFFQEDGAETCFRPNTDQYWYWLRIYHNENKTVIMRERNPKSLSPEELEDMGGWFSPTTILTVNYAVQSVTPQNMHDKLKTLLVFS